MFNSKGVSLASGVIAVLLGGVYASYTPSGHAESGAKGCPLALVQKVANSGGRALECANSSGHVVSLELYPDSEREPGGLTVSVYDQKGDRLASQSHFGDHPLDYRWAGHKVRVSLFDPGESDQIGILFRPFLEPDSGLFTSLVFDGRRRSIKVLGELATDPGTTPSINEDGLLRVQGTSYDVDGVEGRYSVEYQFSEGRFVKLSATSS